MKIPFLHNVRRGLATNSASSHSLVFYNNERSSDDLESGKYIDTDFGWNNFTLDTLGEKLVYALTAVVYRETDWDTVATPETSALGSGISSPSSMTTRTGSTQSAVTSITSRCSASMPSLSRLFVTSTPWSTAATTTSTTTR